MRQRLGSLPRRLKRPLQHVEERLGTHAHFHPLLLRAGLVLWRRIEDGHL
jgi:hypothetical protein